MTNTEIHLKKALDSSHPPSLTLKSQFCTLPMAVFKENIEKDNKHILKIGSFSTTSFKSSVVFVLSDVCTAFLEKYVSRLLPNRVAYILPHIRISYLTRYGTKRRSYWFRLYHADLGSQFPVFPNLVCFFFFNFFISTAVFFNLMFVSVQSVMDV